MDDNIKLAVSERINEIMQGLRQTNADYDTLRKANAELAGRVEAIINSLGDAEKSIWEQHYSLKDQISAIEEEQTYLQGLKDGYRLYLWLKD